MDHAVKLRHTVDALFGRGVSRHLPRDLEMGLSRRTGRLRTVSHGGRLLCTLRNDGGLAVTPLLAGMLLGSRAFRENCVEVGADAAPFVREGRSVFAGHVERCGSRVRVGSETPVLFGGEVIAVGRAVLSAAMMRDMRRGVAVRVR